MTNGAGNNGTEDRQAQHNKVVGLSQEGHRHLKGRRFDKARASFEAGLALEPNNP